MAGVEAREADGATLVARAPKVVLATGGFAGNNEMIRKYNDFWPFKDGAYIPTTNASGHNGDGLNMVLEAGGHAENLGRIRVFPYGGIKDGTLNSLVGDMGDCMFVNKEGKRFIAEDSERDQIVTELMKQTDEVLYVITGENNCGIEGDLTKDGLHVSNLLSMGALYKGDTLEELAEQAGIDPAALAETVERFNEYAANSEDPEFGRVIYTDKSAILEPPYYASPRTWSAHSVPGGVIVDEHYEPVRESDGTPIEGLYTTGEINDDSYGIDTMARTLDLARYLTGETE